MTKKFSPTLSVFSSVNSISALALQWLLNNNILMVSNKQLIGRRGILISLTYLAKEIS